MQKKALPMFRLVAGCLVLFRLLHSVPEDHCPPGIHVSRLDKADKNTQSVKAFCT